jgi:hypothetical protein
LGNESAEITHAPLLAPEVHDRSQGL